MAKVIRERLAMVLRRNIDFAVEGKAEVSRVLSRHIEVDLEELRRLYLEEKDEEDHHRHGADGGSQSKYVAKLEERFARFIHNLHRAYQEMYDSPSYFQVKWVNCLPSFQTKFGVSAFQISPFVEALENVETLASLYSYFYMLYLDTHCSVRCYERWAQLFPNKCRHVRKNGVELSKLDAYEQFI